MSDTDLFEGASGMRIAALTVRFLLELALLAGAAVAVLGLSNGAWRWPAALIAVVAIAVVWGLLLSPKARIPLPSSGALALETLLFAAVGVALYAAGHGALAVMGFALWAIDRIALAIITR